MKVVHILRKPLVGSVAENVREHGTGALNIDATRIGTEVVPIQRWDDGMKPFGDGAGHPYSTTHVTGRWPANLVLQHLPGCRVVGTRRVHKGGGCGQRSRDQEHQDGFLAGHAGGGFSTSHYDENGMETVTAWSCVPGCPVGALDALGIHKSGKMSQMVKGQQFTVYGKMLDRHVEGIGDEGYVTRFFKQVGKPDG